MSSYLRPCIGVPSSPCPPPRPAASTTALYASNGQSVMFTRLSPDRLLQRSAMTACLGWEGPHAPLGLSAPAMRWLSQAQLWAQQEGILLTPPASLAMELHQFADAYCVPRVARAAQRSLADSLSAETFADTWALALEQELTQTSFDMRCVVWGLRHHAALEAADTLGQLERERPEVYRAWVAAVLLCMSRAEPADWRAHEAAFVWALRAAQRLNMSYAQVALPDASQVARDDLRDYCHWVLEHPIWAEVPETTRKWTQGEASVCGRSDYLRHLLEHGVSTDTFNMLTALLQPTTAELNAQLFALLPTYAKRGDEAAMAWLLARAEGTWPVPETRQVLHRALLAALRADRADAVRYLLKAQTPAQVRDLLEHHATSLASQAARWSPQSLSNMLGILRNGGHWPCVNKASVIEAAINAGATGALQTILDALPPSDHQTLVFGDVAIGQAIHLGDASTAAWLWDHVEDATTRCAMLLRHLASMPEPKPWDSPRASEAFWRGCLATLCGALSHLRDADDDAVAEAVVKPLARAAAHQQDAAAIETLLTSRSGSQWHKRCVAQALPVWLQHGGGLHGVRAIINFLSPADAEQTLRTQAVTLAQKAVEGGDVNSLQWLVARVAPRNPDRHALYSEAFNHGLSLYQATERGHVGMVRFWLEDYAHGVFGAQAVAFGDYLIIEDAASANQVDILDMAVAYLQEPGVLNRVMAEKGANAISFAIQNGHRDIMRKLLAWPLSDATRLSILGSDNSPMLWAERGDVDFCRALLAWAPASYQQMTYDMGMSSAVIKACTYDHIRMARFALGQGSDMAKRAMLAVHQGRVVAFAATRGDVVILEQARSLNPLARPTRQPDQGLPPPT